MYSADNNNCNSIQNVLFDAAIQLSVPTVTSTASAAAKIRAYSTTEESIQSSRSRSPSANSRSSLSSSSTHSSRRSNLTKPKVLRDVATQSSPILIQRDKIQDRPGRLDLVLDNNNNPTSKSSISETSKEYLCVPRPNQYKISPSSSPTRHGKSLKNALLGIWQGLNSDELRSAASSPIDSKYFDERIRISTPSWKAFSKVVTSLLTFTRTKQGQYEWIQLVGHPGTFKEGLHDGYILKELSEKERRCCELLQNDILKDFVPKYNGIVKDEEEKHYIEIEDLLASFHDPCIMDCKIGVRTYLEEDLDKSERDPEPRADLYEKMIAIDPTAPTEKENKEKKILKPRYMIWRESLSSSQNLGFRIEAIKKSRDLMSKEFQRIKERTDVRQHLLEFVANSIPRATQYLNRLIQLRATCLRSKFFQTHELIGSSLLFVHDTTRASIWMIDFGKTRLLPSNTQITHSKPWVRGTHEDGYLIGLDNLILLFQEIINDLKLT
ncbi:unnamed protein product [Rotaria sp. Silwood2]|nr:unnamed protein product [Rotaria sp. Silwood2]CAF2529976.1 unnamed protein product [Rotaria sp. Silwood2]CAF2788942.1 unnamed protein product [Rotaria sp. Silwood2]CAF2934070.1 unnamed protein product [Rotaria sp. Silwood2]CAF3914096.1 unnamed protein product [Rotaria sp. Silwood2]